MTYVLAALAILAAAYLLRRKRKPPASGWQFDRWTQGVTLRTVNGLPAFDFPTQGSGVWRGITGTGSPSLRAMSCTARGDRPVSADARMAHPPAVDNAVISVVRQ